MTFIQNKHSVQRIERTMMGSGQALRSSSYSEETSLIELPLPLVTSEIWY